MIRNIFAILFLTTVILSIYSSDVTAAPPGGRQDLPTVPGIERSPLESTVLVSMGWDTRTQTLELEFTNGSVYQYYHVSPSMVRDLKNARSPGTYFDKLIRPKYEYKLVRAPIPEKVHPKLQTIGDIFSHAKQNGAWEKLVIIAKDGTVLGNLDPNKSIDSIWNEFGQHGGEYAQQSIWNQFGSYGGEFSQYSPFNKFTTDPPMLYYNGKSVCYLSANDLTPKPTLTIQEMKAIMESTISTP